MVTNTKGFIGLGDVVDYQQGQYIVVDALFAGQFLLEPLYNRNEPCIEVLSIECEYIGTLNSRDSSS